MLADEDVNIHMISTSTIRVSVVIAAGDMERAARALHTAFGLDDRLTPSYYVTKNSAGRVISEGGSCRTGFMPSRTYTSTTGSTSCSRSRAWI